MKKNLIPKEPVSNINDIDPDKRYAVIIDDFKIQEVSGRSFLTRDTLITEAWIKTGILFEMGIDDDSEYYKVSSNYKNR